MTARKRADIGRMGAGAQVRRVQPGCEVATGLLCLLALLLVLIATPAPARELDADAAGRMQAMCDRAARIAAEEAGVPVDILTAIARVESGRRTQAGFGPWPWTVNEAGEGSFFATPEEAREHVDAALALGKRNIDIGCFQVNIHWHSKGFASLEEMFDPLANGRYAAQLLRQLYDETGSWDGAVGAYHSRRPEAADGYLAKVQDHLDAAPETPFDPPETLTEEAPERPRQPYPLFAGQGGVLGSLVASDAQAATSPLLR